MANVNPVGNGGTPPRVIPTAGEFSADPALANTLGLKRQSFDPITKTLVNENAERIGRELGAYQAEKFLEAVESMEAIGQTMDARFLAQTIGTTRFEQPKPGSRAYSFRQVFGTTDRFGGSYNASDEFYEPLDQSYYSKLDTDRVYAPVQEAAALSDIPTSSSNFARPRTVAAGWKRKEDDPNAGTLTVVFRDGTLWNYYDVPVDVWARFYAAYSKGPMLNNATRNFGAGELVANYTNGPASIDLSDESMRTLYRIARTSQLMYKGTGGTSSKGTPGSAKSRRRVKTNLPKNYQRIQAQTSSSSGGINKGASNGTNKNASNGTNPNQK
jgi:hypothetical protein